MPHKMARCRGDSVNRRCFNRGFSGDAPTVRPCVDFRRTNWVLLTFIHRCRFHAFNPVLHRRALSASHLRKRGLRRKLPLLAILIALFSQPAIWRCAGGALGALLLRGPAHIQFATPATSSTACSSTLLTASRSSGSALSDSWWLMPSLQGAKSMAVGTRLAT